MILKPPRMGPIFLLIVLISIFVSGCASFPASELPTYTHDQLAKPVNKVAATYDVKTVVLGKENTGIASNIEKEIQKILSASPVFTPVTAGAGTGEYHFSFVFRNEGNLVLAFVSGFISGLTFTVIPAYGKDDYILTVDVKQGDQLLKTYSYRDHMDTWLQLFLIFLTPSHWPGDVAVSVIDNMVMNFVHDFAADVQSGVLVARKER